jgi:hypothetical protein
MSEEYRRRADEAELLADIAMSNAHTARIREIARHWREIAEEREQLLDPEHHLGCRKPMRPGSLLKVD